MKCPVDDSIARNLQEGVHRGERQAMTPLYAELRQWRGADAVRGKK